MHARCTLDRAQHLARGHADPRPCVVCRSAWPESNRPPHPAALAKRLPMSGQRERWAAVRSALQFARLFQRGILRPGPASYATTGVYSTFELMARAHGMSLKSSFLLCSLFCDALSLPRGAYLDFPRPREWEGSNCRPLPCAVRCARHPTARRLAQTSEWKTLHRTSPPIISGEPRRRM